MTKAKEKNLTDPVEKSNAAQEAKNEEETLKVLDASNISVEQLTAVTRGETGATHPFEGYPEKKMIIDGREMNMTHIVVLMPTVDVFQDKSGMNRTLPGRGGKPQVVTLKSYRSKVVINEAGDNEDVVFDRVITLKAGVKANYAVVPDHFSRSQIVFQLDENGKLEPNTEYRLLDGGQTKRLKSCFTMIHYQQLKGERAAEIFDKTPSNEDSSGLPEAV